jgi:Family of unknown function (DUF6118)
MTGPDEQTGPEASPALAPLDPAAAAFEALREEVALARRAVAGLAAERAALEIPDYSETLAQILHANTITAKRLRALNEAPALQMSASTWGQDIANAGEAARRGDRHALSEAKAALQDAAGSLKAATRSAREADRQRAWLKATGIAGLIVGLALGAVIAGWLAPSLFATVQSPEERAATILGMSEEKAGEHLIESASPKLWQDLVLGDRIVTANRDVLVRCQRDAHKGQEHCVIKLQADEP